MWWDKDSLDNHYTWYWIDETPLNYFKWALQQNEHESVMFAALSVKYGDWFYSHSTSRLPFICERWLFGTPTPEARVENLKNSVCFYEHDELFVSLIILIPT